MGPSADEIGAIGQTALETWAAQASITANRAIRDQRGWDVLLQLSSDISGGPLDRAPPDITCMVQVKTSAKGSRREAISLSNWRRMCTDLTPWFVLFIHLDEDYAPAFAYLVHIDENWCGRTLRRMRELDPVQRMRLHKSEMDVTYRDSDQLPSLHGRALKQRIQEDVGPDLHQYAQRKCAWYTDTGYADKRKSVELSVAVENPNQFWNEIADLSVGSRATFPEPWVAKVSDTRFGVEATISEFDHGGGPLVLESPRSAGGTLRVSSALGDTGDLECSIFRARDNMPRIPDEFDRIRVATKHFALVIYARPNGTGVRSRVGAMHTRLPVTDPVTLADIRVAVTILRALVAHGEHPVTIRVAGPGGVKEYSPPAIEASSMPTAASMDVLDRALDVAKYFGIDPSTEAIVGDLLTQSDSIEFMWSTIGCNGKTALETSCQDEIPLGSRLAVSTEYSLQLANCRLVLHVGALGHVTAYDSVDCRASVAEASVLLNAVVTVSPHGVSDLKTEASRNDVYGRLCVMGYDCILVR